MDLNDISRKFGVFVRLKFQRNGFYTDPSSLESKLVADGLMERTRAGTMLTRLGTFYYSRNMFKMYQIFRQDVWITDDLDLPANITVDLLVALTSGICTAAGPCSSDQICAANAVGLLYLLGLPVETPTPQEMDEIARAERDAKP